MERFKHFGSTQERFRMAQEVMEAGRVECEGWRGTPDGSDEHVIQRIVEWRVQALGAYCVLRHYTHRNEFEDGEMVRKPIPFCHLFFNYDRPAGGRAELTMRLDAENSNIISSSPPPPVIWNEAMAHFDESLRFMQAHIKGGEPGRLPVDEPAAIPLAA